MQVIKPNSLKFAVASLFCAAPWLFGAPTLAESSEGYLTDSAGKPVPLVAPGTQDHQAREMRYALIFLLLAGCASDGSHDYVQSEARAVQTVDYGTVQSVREVKIKGDNAVVGTVTGAAIGGLLGNQIGHGGGRAAATVIGAVGGGIAGNAIERTVTAQDGQEVVVRLDSGNTIAVVQPGMQSFSIGERVRVLTGPKGTRVEQG